MSFELPAIVKSLNHGLSVVFFCQVLALMGPAMTSGDPVSQVKLVRDENGTILLVN